MTSTLFKRGFASLLVVQFFGAANDNILKQVLIFMVGTGIWKAALGEGSEGIIALFLTVPFILLSGFAGQFADRHSKRRVIRIVKIVEIPVALLALVGLWTGSLPLTLAAFTLLAIQSTFFGPAKYGVIPELVGEGDLSRANGTLNMLTNVAIIAGTLAAGPVCDAYFPGGTGAEGPGIAWLPGVVLLVVAIVGLVSTLALPPLAPQDPTLTYTWNPFSTYVKTIRQMARGPLLLVAGAWSFFYLVGMMAILILPQYSDVLSITYTRTSYLIGLMGISIGVGSVAAGLISGHHIEPRLIPVGAVGMTVFFFLLGAVAPTYWGVAAFLSGAGIFAGFYIVPLQALLQKLSPADARGRYLGTANAMSFVASTVGSIVLVVARSWFGLEPNRVFLVCAAIAALGTGLLLLKMRRLLADARRHGPPGV